MEWNYYVIKRGQRLCNGMLLLCHKERAEAVEWNVVIMS